VAREREGSSFSCYEKKKKKKKKRKEDRHRKMLGLTNRLRGRTVRAGPYFGAPGAESIRMGNLGISVSEVSLEFHRGDIIQKTSISPGKSGISCGSRMLLSVGGRASFFARRE